MQRCLDWRRATVRAGLVAFEGLRGLRWLLMALAFLACDPDTEPLDGGAMDAEARDAGSCGVADGDGDGAASTACGGNDCDDADPRRFPGNQEVCDAEGIDEDCDPLTFAARGGVGDRDADGSALPECCNVSGDVRTCGSECDDARPDRGERATEVCNEIDDDCDGEVDEEVSLDFGPDLDLDGFGADVDLVRACFPPRGRGLVSTRVGIEDCDDAEPETSRGHLERCEGSDDDCDGVIDEGCACGGPAACEVCSTSVRPCEGGELGECEASQNEVCNSRDDDCDARVDEGFETRLCFRDADGDGFAPSVAFVNGPTADLRFVCATTDCPSGPGATFVERRPVGVDNVDCDDDEPSVHPGAAELDNGADDDCDSMVDEGD